MRPIALSKVVGSKAFILNSKPSKKFHLGRDLDLPNQADQRGMYSSIELTQICRLCRIALIGSPLPGDSVLFFS